MDCPNGHPMGEGQRFCAECGSAVPSMATPELTAVDDSVEVPGPDQRKGRPRWLLPVVGAAAALIAAGTLAAVLLLADDEEGTDGLASADPPPVTLSAEERAAAECRDNLYSALVFLIENDYSDAAIRELAATYGTQSQVTKAALFNSREVRMEALRNGRQQAIDSLTSQQLDAACAEAEG